VAPVLDTCCRNCRLTVAVPQNAPPLAPLAERLAFARIGPLKQSHERVRSILGGPTRAIDDQRFHGPFLRLELHAELLLKRCEKVVSICDLRLDHVA